jgi:hypothetical protein
LVGYLALLIAALLLVLAGFDNAQDYSRAEVSNPDPNGHGYAYIDHPSWDYYGPALYSLAMGGVVPLLILLDWLSKRMGFSTVAAALMVPVAGIWSYWGVPGGTLTLLLSFLGTFSISLSKGNRIVPDTLVASTARGTAVVLVGLLMAVGLQDIYWFGIQKEYIFNPSTLEYIRTKIMGHDLTYINQGLVATAMGAASYCLLTLAFLRRADYLLVIPGGLAIAFGYIDAMTKDNSMSFFGPILVYLGVITILLSLVGPLLLHPDRKRVRPNDPYGNPP